MMTRFLPLSLTLALFATISPLFAKDTMPLMIYGVSIGEEKAVVVKFHEKDGKPILEVVQSEPLVAPAGSITHHPDHNLLYIGARRALDAEAMQFLFENPGVSWKGSSENR